MKKIIYLIITFNVIVFSQSNNKLSFLSHFGDGVPNSVYLKNNIAYLIEGTNIQIIDYSDPLILDTLSELKFSTPINDLFFDNDILFAIGDSLYFIDCKNIYKPQIVKKLDFIGNKIKKYSDLIILVDKKVISLIKFNNINNLELLTNLHFDNNINNFEFDGSFIYVGTTSGLHKINAIDTHNLKFVHNYEAESGNGINDLKLFNNYLYALESNKLLTFDLNSNDSLFLINSLDLRHYLGKLYINNNIAYVTNKYGLYTVDLSNSAKPLEVGGYSTSEITNLFIDSENICWLLHSTYAVPKPIEIIEASSWPQKISEIEIIPFYNLIANYNNYVIASFKVLNKIVIVDFNDYKNPKIISSFYSNNNANSLKVFDKLLFISTTEGIEIYDISNIKNPKLFSQIDIGKNCGEIIVKENFCYLSYEDGLKILDISNLQDPIIVGTFLANNKQLGKIEIFNDYIYSVDFSFYDPEISVIDIINVKNPVKIGGIKTIFNSISIKDILIDYPYLIFTGNFNNHLVFCDISNPKDIKLAKVFNFPDDYNPYSPYDNLVLSKPYLYCLKSGVCVLNIDNIDDIKIVDYKEFPYHLESLFGDNNKIYFLNSYTGINIFTSELITSINNNYDKNFIYEDYIQNYPNPFNNSTHIRFSLKNSSYVNLIIYNSLGQKIEVIIDKFLNKGTYDYLLNTEKYCSGIYYYQIITDGYSSVKKMIHLK